MRRSLLPCIFLAQAGLLLTAGMLPADDTGLYRSHPPVRPLAVPSTRPLEKGPVRFVDALRGDDANEGSLEQPWKTVTHAAKQLQPGDTLCLRGGTYFEHVAVECSGTPQAPITIRSYPGELAIINGGIREFVESPQTAWEPMPGGVAGEFRSRRTFPGVGTSPGGCYFLGNFGDSLVPLQGYRFLEDLRDPSMVWDVTEKVGDTEGVYCGPGIGYDVATGYIHARLAHTTLKALGDDNYRGETDPRKLPLVIAGIDTGPALAVHNSRHLRFQDLMVCGARTATIDLSDCRDLTFDGVTAYGGYTAFGVKGTTGLRLYHTACRGIAAPWTFRGHLKYRSVEARIFSASGWSPTGRDNQDFELAYSEFTDSVDGVFIGNVRNVHFHHNLLDNVSDDGIFLTATTAYDGTTHGGEHYIHQNLLSRCLSTFAFGVGHGRQKMTETGRQTGAGVWVSRNVFDLRRPVHYHLPAPDDPSVESHGRVTGEHGGPAWEPIYFYHNTILENLPLSREYYLSDLAGHMGGGVKRRLFNNIAVQGQGIPGRRFPSVILPADDIAANSGKPGAKEEADPLGELLEKKVEKKSPQPITIKTDLDPQAIRALKEQAGRKPARPLPSDFEADGNLHWGFYTHPSVKSLFQSFRESDDFAASQRLYPPGWGSHDLVADPGFVSWNTDWKQAIDVGLSSRSPAVNAGVALPADWPDALRDADRGKPDVGAIPADVAPWRVGIRGRLTVFGQPAEADELAAIEPIKFPDRSAPAARLLRAAGPPPDAPAPDGATQSLTPRHPARKPAAIVQGYPAFDAEFVEFVLKKHGIAVDIYDRTWLDTADYSRYSLVVIVGDLGRAKMEPREYTAADVTRVKAFLEQGGTLLVMRAGRQAFGSDEGWAFLRELVGISPPFKGGEFKFLKADHPWLKHVDPNREHTWLNARIAMPLQRDAGEALVGTDDGRYATLLRTPVGKGQFVYLGWEIAEFLRREEAPATVEDERNFEEQIRLLENIVETLP